MSIRLYFDQWPTYNARIVEIARDMTDEQLAIRPAPSRWPIWATLAHTAGTRVYWLCGFLGEPGAESTPLPEAVTGLIGAGFIATAFVDSIRYNRRTPPK